MLADQSGRSKRFSEDFLREFFALISETLEAGESVKVKGLGTFRLSRVEPRKSVDVTTGEPMEISGHSKVVFVPAKELAETVNSPFEAFTTIEIGDDVDIENLIPKDEDIETDDSEDLDDTDDSDELISAISPRESEYDISSLTSTPLDVIDFNNGMVKVSEDPIEDPLEETPDLSSPNPSENDDNEEPKEQHPADTDDDTIDDAAYPQKPEEDSIVESSGNEAENPDPEMNSEDEHIEEHINEDENINEYEEKGSNGKNWIKTIMIILGAAVLGLILTFAIWYFVATNDFKNKLLPNSSSIALVDNNSDSISIQPIQNSLYPEDSTLADNTETDIESADETEETVPTAPSDEIVYDTIGNTRYLTTMAKSHYGNYNLWPYIYEENKSILGHPDRIRPGTPVVIPKLSKYGVDPKNEADIEKAKKMGVEIYARYGKKI